MIRILLATVLALGASALGAQSYPSKPVRLIAAVPPGTPPDTIGRIVARELTDQLGQQVLVENRPGAGTTLGMAAAAAAAPDGYTLVMLATSAPMAQALYTKPGFDTDASFAPISLVAQSPFFLVVHPGVAANSMEELVLLSRRAPGTLNYGTAGSGTPPHIVMELFKAQTGASLVHVPYKANHFPGVLAGEVQASFDVPTLFAPHAKAGKVRLLAVAARERHPDYPAVPTAAESGAPGFEASAWYGIAAPRGTAPEIIARLHAATAQALKAAALRETFAKLATEPISSTPAEFGAMIRTEVEKWGKAVKASGAKVD